MGDWVIRLNSLIEKMMFILIPGAIVFGYVFWDYLEHAKFWVYVMFAYMTFVSALNCSWSQFRALAKEPVMFGASLILVHLLIPAIAFVSGKIFFPNDMETVIGLVIATTIPVAVTAVVWTNISQGNNSFSLALVVLDTLISPIVLPLFIYIVFGMTGGVLSIERLVYDMMLMVVIPSILGLVFHPYRFWSPKGPVQAGLGALSKIGLFTVVAINVAILHDFMAQGWSNVGPILLALVTVTLLSYLLGYGTGRLLRRPPGDVIALTYSSGMRNIALGVVFSVGYFEPRVSIPIVFFSLIQQPLATLVHRFLEKAKRRSLGMGRA